ncbi:MAG: PilN domain-containing protein [Patescibacteria group bacterium]
MKYKINLIEKEGGKGSFLNKLNYFFFNYFRYILVFTQLVVISVLFFRFTIDQSIIDLKESINQQEELLKAVRPILDESQRIDAKLKKADLIIKDQEILSEQLNYLLPTFPSTVFLNTLAFTKESARMDGIILNPTHLQAFVNKIKEENLYKDVSLSAIERTEQGYAFSITLNGFKQ